MATRAPVLFLHGFTGGGEAWAGIAERLAPGRAWLAPNLVGHGREPAIVATFDEEVQRVAAILERAFGGQKAHLCGYSMGGRLALALLVRCPGLVERATIVGANPGLDVELERATRRAGDEAWARRIETEGLDAFYEAWSKQPLFATQQSLDASVLERQKAYRALHTQAGLAASMRAMTLADMPSLWAPLRAVDVPVDVVVGERDAKFRALGQRLVEHLRSGRLVVVPGAGHNVPLERPDAIVELLERG